MKRLAALAITVLLISCISQNKGTSIASKSGASQTTKTKLLNEDTFKLVKQATNKTYGYSKDNSIKVGGGQYGPLNERRFLNALLGPNDEKIFYSRTGSCCMFKTPNGLFGDSGMLDMYSISIEGTKDSTVLYLNMYDKGELEIPVGFKAK